MTRSSLQGIDISPDRLCSPNRRKTQQVRCIGELWGVGSEFPYVDWGGRGCLITRVTNRGLGIYIQIHMGLLQGRLAGDGDGAGGLGWGLGAWESVLLGSPPNFACKAKPESGLHVGRIGCDGW